MTRKPTVKTYNNLKNITINEWKEKTKTIRNLTTCIHLVTGRDFLLVIIIMRKAYLSAIILNKWILCDGIQATTK